MKYFFSTLPKLIGLTALLFASKAQAQVGLSPYSRFGLGELNTNYAPALKTMGGASVAISDWNQLNIDNPASYAFLKQYRPVFEADFTSQILSLSANGASSTQRGSNISRFSMGLPISKKLGLGFGIMPYSAIGYNITATATDPVLGKTNYLYEGSGGLNKTYLGLGGFLIDRDSTQLSIGVDAGFIFGKTSQEERIEFPDANNALFTKSARDVRYRGFIFNTGLQFKHKLTDNIKLLLGGTVSFEGNINTTKDEVTTTYNRIIAERTIDTLASLTEVKGTANIPIKYSFGAALEINKNFTISTQATFNDWSSFNRTFNKGVTQTDTLTNAAMYSLGGRYRPLDVFSRENIFQRTEYRFGVRYGNTAVKYNNTSLTEFGMSFGLGIPVATSSSSRTNYKSVTMLQLGVEYGTRGGNIPNGVKENVTTLYFGVSIMPGKLDRWFRKRKIN